MTHEETLARIAHAQAFFAAKRRERQIDEAVQRYQRKMAGKYTIIDSVRDHPHLPAENAWAAWPHGITEIRAEFRRVVVEAAE